MNFRLDRALTVGLFSHVSHVLKSRHQIRVPILMYHGINSEHGLRHPYFETNTSPSLFTAHMRFLHENGYKTVDLNEALEGIIIGRNQEKRVAITFDDGLQDFYVNALPVLAEYGFKATMFVVSGLAGDRPFQRGNKIFLSWPELRDMCSNGIRIGSHTVTHPDLVVINRRDVEFEIRQSKETIEDKLGEPIRSFSYPYGFPENDRKFTEFLKTLLQTHGYEEGVTTIIGTASCFHDWFFLPRIPINDYDDLQFFKAKLEGCYDWLHSAQIIYKKTIKRFLEKQITNPTATEH